MRNGRGHRLCSRAGCRHLASKTLTYIYADSTAVLGPLATFAEPHAYDLCDQHSIRLSAPVGWTVIKQEPNDEFQGPSNDDLMAVAAAVAQGTNGTHQLSQVVRKTIGNWVGQEHRRKPMIVPVVIEV